MLYPRKKRREVEGCGNEFDFDDCKKEIKRQNNRESSVVFALGRVLLRLLSVPQCGKAEIVRFGRTAWV